MTPIFCLLSAFYVPSLVLTSSGTLAHLILAVKLSGKCFDFIEKKLEVKEA